MLALDINNLSYEPDTDPSIAVQRQLLIRYPEKSTYTNGEKMSYILSGNAFLDGKNSSMTMTLKAESASANFLFGQAQGSALNIFNRVRVVSGSGKVISDVLDHNLFAAVASRMKLSKQYRSIVGSSFGHGGVTLATADTHHFQIPLMLLSPFFNSNQLIPPSISEGLIIELYLETPAQAFESAAGVTSYTVSNAEIVIDSSQVADQYMKMIMSMPMTYEFTDVVQSDAFMSSANQQIEHVIPHSLTNAVEAFGVLRKQSDVNNGLVNSFNTVGPALVVTNADEMKWSVGSIKLPQQPALGSLKIYNILLNTQQVLSSRTCDSFNIDYSADFATKIGVYSVDLCRSRMYANSGRELSNGQRLSLFVKQSIAADYLLDCFVYHTARVVAVFSSDVKHASITVER
tara:strand:- start:3762 stop:4970 length:1209 start_codon:yes stop_codon:yes gene_type:complete